MVQLSALRAEIAVMAQEARTRIEHEETDRYQSMSPWTRFMTYIDELI